MQKHVNLVDLVKGFPTNIFLQNLASIQPKTILIKFDHLDEKSEQCSISNLSTKCETPSHPRGRAISQMSPSRRCAAAAQPSIGVGSVGPAGIRPTSNYLTLKGSFSAVSKPNFASKYSLELAICSKKLSPRST